MSKNIVEESPVAKPAAAGSQPTGGQDKVRKQARQLAYDVRYKVKQGFKEGQKTDPASLKRAYMAQLGKSPAPGPVKLLAKKMLIGESYDFVDISETVTKSVANAVGRVFVKTVELEDADGNPAFEITDLVQEEIKEKKYKIRVTDKKTGKSYVRYADRAKISELRKNPNISSVEMTGYGTPYEGERKKGSTTAKVKAGKDFDGDGKVESPTAEYKGSRDKAIKKALHKEEFIDEITKDAEDANPQANRKKIDVMKGTNKIEVNPKLGEQANPAAAEEKLKKDDDLAGAPNPKEDPKEKRVRLMKRQILQKKMQAVRSGAGADIVAHNEPEGEVIAEKDLDAAERRALPDKDFALPGKGKGPEGKQAGSYPIPDKNHARMALAMVAKHGSAEDKAKVRAAVAKKFPGIQQEEVDQLQEKEVDVKDTYKTVAAIVDYDRAKKGSKDADWDSLHGKKKAAKKERDYAAWERSKMKKDDPNWKHKKYHTGMHGEEVEMEENALTEEFINENIEVATNYFYKEGLNEEGLDLVIEEVGVDDFTDFVLGLSQQLNEEREAKKAPKRDYEKVKAAVYAKDAERKAKGTGEYAKTKAAKEKYGDKPAPEGKPEKKVEVKKKVEKSVAKAKKVQPLKPISKPGLGDKIRGAVKKGVERHKAAVGKAKGEVKKIAKTASDTAKQHAGHRKKFVSGLKATSKEKKIASGIGKAVKKAVVGEDAEYGYDKDGKSLNPDDKPIKDQTDKQIADVTFDGGAAIPATIKGSGDEREIPTAINLIKNKMRARGILVAHKESDWRKELSEKKSDTLATEAKVDEVTIDETSKYDKSEVAKHGEGRKRARRDTTAAMERDGWGYAKVGRQQKERQERHKADRGVKTKGTKAGHSGSAYPTKSATLDTMYPHKKEARLKRKIAARKAQGVKEEKDQAFANVVARLKAKHGDGVLASKKDFEDHKKREAAKPKPKAKPQKPLTSKEKAQREVDARYGRTAWNKKGSLGT